MKGVASRGRVAAKTPGALAVSDGGDGSADDWVRRKQDPSGHGSSRRPRGHPQRADRSVGDGGSSTGRMQSPSNSMAAKAPGAVAVAAGNGSAYDWVNRKQDPSGRGSPRGHPRRADRSGGDGEISTGRMQSPSNPTAAKAPGAVAVSAGGGSADDWVSRKQDPSGRGSPRWHPRRADKSGGDGGGGGGQYPRETDTSGGDGEDELIAVSNSSATHFADVVSGTTEVGVAIPAPFVVSERPDLSSNYDRTSSSVLLPLFLDRKVSTGQDSSQEHGAVAVEGFAARERAEQDGEGRDTMPRSLTRWDSDECLGVDYTEEEIALALTERGTTETAPAMGDTGATHRIDSTANGGNEEEIITDSNMINEEKAGRKCETKKVLLVVLVLAVIAVAIAVPVALTKPSQGETQDTKGIDLPTLSPTRTVPQLVQSPTPPPTLAPTSALLPQAIQILSPVSGDKLFQEGTPANNALNWIVNDDPLNRDPSDPRFIQRYIIVVFRFATSDALKYLTGSDDECTWEGITCKNGTIINIKQGARRFNAGNHLPTELASLPDLESLDVRNNNLGDQIPPEIFGMVKLKRLLLAENRFTGIIPGTVAQLGSDMTGGAKINLARNMLSSRIPVEIASVVGLKELQLHGNEFTGTVPEALCALETNPSESSIALTLITTDCDEVDCSCSDACQCF